MKSSSDSPIIINKNAYLPGVEAAVTTANREYFAPASSDSKTVTVKKESIKYIPWGSEDNFPNTVVTTIGANPTLARGTEFNIVALFGKGIKPVKIVDGVTTELDFDHEVSQFFLDNDINTWFLEQCSDMQCLFNTFPELILSQDGSKIVQLNHKEAVFSRLQERNDKGIINNHLYCAKFGTTETISDNDIEASQVLAPSHTLNNLKYFIGKLEGSKDSKKRRFVLPVRFPTPGRIYYPKPYWTSLLESGWIEFDNQIPEYKKALMTNQMTVKYQIVISEDYFPYIFTQEGITDPEQQKARIKLEYTNLQKFLTDTKNTAKSVVTYSKKYHGTKGYELKSLMEINAIENHFKGGEYLEDSQEVHNIISYAIGVHPSITGASPGKTGSISGTEARELFNLKRALLFPFRWQLLKVLYLIKRYNNWENDIYFAIEDVALTTLDKDKTGTETVTQLFKP